MEKENVISFVRAWNRISVKSGKAKRTDLQDDDVLQSGRVLEPVNIDFCSRPTDLSWHFLVVVIIREEPFNCRSRTYEK